MTEQDLTDYALNELDPHERLYVESMLAVSEECRNDIYETIDTAMLLEEVFEREDANHAPACLTDEQRRALLNVRVPNYFLHRTAASLAAAAAVAVAFVNKDVWLPKGPVRAEVARVSSQMTSYVAQAVSAASSTEGEDFVNQLASFRKLTEDPVKWLPTQPPGGAAVFGSSPALNIEVAPHAGLDLMP